MRIVPGAAKHVEAWARLRAALWPDQSIEDHRSELTRLFLAGNDRVAAFVAQAESGEIIGFAEASLRGDYVNGCVTTPVAFLEGIYVRLAERRNGAGRLLCDAVESWGKSLGCVEFASDALLENSASLDVHAALGFRETERVVFFRKLL